MLCVGTTDLKKKDGIEPPIVCTRQKSGYFDRRRHLGETTLHATALDLLIMNLKHTNR